MSKLKIGIAIDLVHKVGGTQRSTWELADYLGKEHEVILLTKKSFASGDENFKVKVLSSMIQIPYLENLIFAWKVSLQKRRLKLDVLNVQGSNGLWQDIVTAQSVHKKWFFWSLGETKRFSKAWFLKVFNPMHYLVIFIETLQYRMFSKTHIIAISEQVKSDIMQYFNVSSNRISVVHHGVNNQEFNPNAPRSKVRESLEISAQETVAIFVAHEFKRKGLSILLNSLKMCSRPIHLLIVGKDSPDSYRLQVKDLGLETFVHFVGAQKNLHDWYAAADFFVFPTKYEAFGMVITEAMAAGLPVIVPKDAGAAELIKDGVDGLLLNNWDDERQLSQLMLKLFDKEFRKKVGAAARKTAEARPWSVAAEETLAVYRKVCNCD